LRRPSKKTEKKNDKNFQSAKFGIEKNQQKLFKKKNERNKIKIKNTMKPKGKKKEKKNGREGRKEEDFEDFNHQQNASSISGPPSWITLHGTTLS